MDRSCRYRFLYVLSDLLAIVIGTICFNCIRYLIEGQVAQYSSLDNFLFSPKMYVVQGVLIVFWLFIFTLSGYYNKILSRGRLDEFFLTASSLFIGTVIEYLGLVVDDIIRGRQAHVLLFILLYFVYFTLIYSGRLWITMRQIRYDRQPAHWQRILLIGTPRVIDQMLTVQEEMHFQARAILSLQDRSALSIDTIRCTLDTIAQAGSPIEEIYMIVSEGDSPQAMRLLYELYRLKMPIKLYTDHLLVQGNRLQARTLKGMPLYNLTDPRMSPTEQNIKWLFDRLMAGLLLVLLAPVFAVLALLVYRSSPGPIFYSQERIGLLGKPFRIYKFRSMYLNAEPDGPVLSSELDPRITPLGRILRKYRLDELPQLYNVLIGDMSFVGPRPERAYYIQQLLDEVPYYYLLHQIRPGITSWGMVRYGYASTIKQMLQRLHYDWLYYEHMSLKLDITILFYTIGTILKGKGK